MMQFSYVLLLLFVSGSECKTHEFEYKEERDNITHLLVLELEDAELSCSLPAHLARIPGYLSWEKSVLVPEAGYVYDKIDEVSSVTPPGWYPDEKITTRFEGEFSEEDPSRSRYILYLPNTMKEPRDGRYTCLFNPFDADKSGSERTEIKVYLVRVIVEETSQTFAYDYPPNTQDIALTCFEACDADDQKYLLTRWFYFPTRINAPSHDYGLLNERFMQVKREHKSSSAVYYCSIEGLQFTRKILVNIMYLPDVYMPGTSEIYKSERDSLRLVCLVDSYPLASISWSGSEHVNKAKREDLLMVDWTLGRKSEFLRPSPGIRKSTLEIDSLEAGSFGKYVCSACNSMGCSNNTITVKRTITEEMYRKP